MYGAQEGHERRRPSEVRLKWDSFGLNTKNYFEQKTNAVHNNSENTEKFVGGGSIKL